MQIGCSVKRIDICIKSNNSGHHFYIFASIDVVACHSRSMSKLSNWRYCERRVLLSWKINHCIILNEVWYEEKPIDPINSISASEPLLWLKFHRLHIFRYKVSFLKIKVYSQQWYDSTFDLAAPHFLTLTQPKPVHWLSPTSAPQNRSPSTSLFLPAQLLVRTFCG